MKLSQFSGTNLIELELRSTNSDDVIDELSELLGNSDKIDSVQTIKSALIEREELASTGIGFGVALPHARAKSVKGLTVAFGRSEKGIDFGAIDHNLVHLFFVIVVPETAVNTHLTALGKLSYLLKEKDNREILLNATFPQEVLDLINQE
ncbi:PTS sugar transporter subunit IIA [bacterium]|nr:PTS sugar transporter subunit IIA [bacterium]